jgi:hypothetical protein
MNRNRNSTWRPHLEALESRWCPACDVRLIGSTLFVTGDSGDNDIAIVNDGSGILHVDADGVTRDFTETINRVVVRAGAGNDDVFVADYDFEFVGGISRAWMLDLGSGDDGVAVNLFGFLDATASVTVLGGAGDDNISVGPTVLVQSAFFVTIAGGDGNDTIFNNASDGVGPSGTMVVTLLGGNGDDMIFDFYDLFSVDGAFVGLTDGGNGSDFVGVGLGELLEFDPNLPPLVFGFDVAAGGYANYAVLGGIGNDSVFAGYFGRTYGQFGMVVDAGSGDDEIFAGLNIHVESTGQFSALLRGGNGNDSIGVNVTFFETELVEIFPGYFVDGLAGLSETPAPLSQRFIVANGGNGFDACLHSDWVSLLGVEDDQPL